MLICNIFIQRLKTMETEVKEILKGLEDWRKVEVLTHNLIHIYIGNEKISENDMAKVGGAIRVIIDARREL